MLTDLIQNISQGAVLEEAQVHQAVEELVSGEVEAEVKANFLIALARRGETPDEIAAFAQAIREKSIRPPIPDELRKKEIIDVCGTGGDRLNTFNISTTVSLIVAAAGVPVAKHGNRAITSQSGSADVLEELGIPVNLTPAQAADSLRDHDFAFFFAPNYHPAFKNIGPARKICAEKGERTIFNYLGPLLNPARPSCQLIGVPNPDWCEPLARVLQSLGVRRGMVVSGRVNDQFLDEISTMGDSHVAEFYQEKAFHVSHIEHLHLPVQPAKLEDLVGGNSTANAQTIRRLISGKEKGPKRDAVLVNAGAALFVAGKADSLTEGWELAGELLRSGKVNKKLNELSVCGM